MPSRKSEMPPAENPGLFQKVRFRNPNLFLLTRDRLFAVLLVVATLLVYYPAWHGTPLWDDDFHITKPELRSLDGLAKIWTTPGTTEQYYPLVHTVFWVEHHLWGDQPTGYHLVNILLHAFSALLLYRILRRLAVPGARFAAVLFALHPVMVESVAWITELKNALSMFFFLASILAYLRFDRRREEKRRGEKSRSEKGALLASLLFFIAGLASKTSIAPLPLVLPVILWWKRGRLSVKRDALPLVPFFVAALASGFATIWVEHRFVGTRGSGFAFSALERCLIAGRAFWFYLGKIVWPSKLIFIYPRWTIDAAAWWQYLFPAAAVALAGIAVAAAVKKHRRAPLALFLYFAAMLLPVAGFISQYAFKFSFVADHWVYLAAIAPLVAAGAGVRSLSSLARRRLRLPRLVVPVVIAGVLAALTFRQSAMYGDAETLYRTTLERNPDSWMTHNNLALLFENQCRREEALVHYRRALEINPDFLEGHLNIGSMLLASGNVDEAIDHFRTATKIDPTSDGGYFDLGTALLMQGRVDEAIVNLQTAVRCRPDNTEALITLATALLNAGRYDEALARCRRALELKPQSDQALGTLGKAYLLAGRPADALDFLRRAAAINRSDLSILKDLSTAYLQSGEVDSAIAAAGRARDLARSSGQEALAAGIGQVMDEMRGMAAGRRL